MRSRRLRWPPSRPVARHRWPVAIALAGAALGLAACAGYQPLIAPPSSAPVDAGSPSATTAPDTSATPTGIRADDLPTFEVGATELAYDAPASIPAGRTRIVLANRGAEDHNALIVRLADPADYPELRAQLMGTTGPGIAALGSMAGGLSFVPPGGQASVVVDFEPGTYVLVDYARGPDGYPHFAKGMMTPLEVAGPWSATPWPDTGPMLTLHDFGYDGVESIAPGHATITIRNEGTQPHEVNIARLADGVTVDDIRAAIDGGGSLPGEPWSAVGGSAAIAPGSTVQLDVDLPTGDYAFFCVWTDSATRKQHLQLGMVAPLTVGVP